MLKIKQNIENVIIVDKSTFIANLFKVNRVEDTKLIIEEIKKKYNDANHNCYAYILDDGLIQKCSDDGEPSQTAGYPMIDVLKKQNITDILAITTRYFGGIKLGAGGLVRAYSKSVSDALLTASFTTTKEYSKYSISFEYSFFSYIQAIDTIKIVEQHFTDNVTLTILIPLESIEDVIDKIKNLTKSKVSIIFIENVKLDV